MKKVLELVKYFEGLSALLSSFSDAISKKKKREIVSLTIWNFYIYLDFW